MCFIRAYLRASTDEQDATRARAQIQAFAAERQMQVAAWYIENESGAKLHRPELFRLLSDAHAGDVLLVEQVDRLSRRTAGDWERLKSELATRKVRTVALDLPTSWIMATGKVDDFTSRMFEAINNMMLDMLAAIARKDFEDRRRRQREGIERSRAAGKFRGRPENARRNKRIAAMRPLARATALCRRQRTVPGPRSRKIAKRAKAAPAPV